MERALGRDFGDVRVHTDSPLAGLTGASALTVGQHVFFGPGLYAPGRASSRELLAHELTHVAQNAATPHAPRRAVSHPSDESEREATRVQHAVVAGKSPGRPHAAASGAIHRQPTQQPPPDTTAPIANYTLEPRLAIVNEVANENKLFASADNLIPWLQKRATKNTEFTRKEMFEDSTATSALTPPPTTAQDLDPVLGLLAHHKVIVRRLSLIGADDKPIDPLFKINTKVSDGTPPVTTVDDTAFQTAKGKTASLEKDMRKKAPEVGLSGPARDKANESIARAPLVATTNVTQGMGTGAGANLPFANSIIALLNRVRAINPDWNVGQYPSHDYREYSADIYLKAYGTGGYFTQSAANTFFDNLNTAAKDTGNADGFGLFGWRGIYNDEAVQDAVNAKYGADRVISAPGHGPLGKRALAAGMQEPKKPVSVHIHLDLRPMDLSKDARVGYSMQGGRVVIP